MVGRECPRPEVVSAEHEIGYYPRVHLVLCPCLYVPHAHAAPIDQAHFHAVSLTVDPHHTRSPRARAHAVPPPAAASSTTIPLIPDAYRGSQ